MSVKTKHLLYSNTKIKRIKYKRNSTIIKENNLSFNIAFGVPEENSMKRRETKEFSHLSTFKNGYDTNKKVVRTKELGNFIDNNAYLLSIIEFGTPNIEGSFLLENSFLNNSKEISSDIGKLLSKGIKPFEANKTDLKNKIKDNMLKYFKNGSTYFRSNKPSTIKIKGFDSYGRESGQLLNSLDVFEKKEE